MNPMLEYKKLKRTALLPALILGGLLAAALPAPAVIKHSGDAWHSY